MWHRLAVILVVLGTLGAVYCLWAYHRIRPQTLMAESRNGVWPRPSPYPDQWLLALNNYYDQRYPAPRGSIKLHGELVRVRWTVLFGFLLCATVASIGGLPLAFRRYRIWHARGRGFPVVPMGSSPKDNGETDPPSTP